MLVVPHAELGQLPLALLVTKATAQPSKAGVPFAGYKAIPWLSRDIAIAQIPSVTALAALRNLPAGSDSRKILSALAIHTLVWRKKKVPIKILRQLSLLREERH